LNSSTPSRVGHRVARHAGRRIGDSHAPGKTAPAWSDTRPLIRAVLCAYTDALLTNKTHNVTIAFVTIALPPELDRRFTTALRGPTAAGIVFFVVQDEMKSGCIECLPRTIQ
jgi:hypothetical protein